MVKHQSSYVRSLNYDNEQGRKILLISLRFVTCEVCLLTLTLWVKAFIRNIRCWSCDCSHKVSLVVEERFEGFNFKFWSGWGGVGVFRGRGCKKGAILRKCLNTFVLHCGLMNLQAYKSCYASQRETVAKCYVWVTSVSNSFHCSSVLQPLSQSACVKHKYSNNNQRITIDHARKYHNIP